MSQGRLFSARELVPERQGEWSPLSVEPPKGSWGVSFGGGTNSTALLLTLHDRGLRPDWVLFADTGSEQTYELVERVEPWCREVGFPFEVVRWIRKDGTFEPLHEHCLRTEYLPSKAYGFSGCTVKWKIQPMARWRKEHGYEESTVAIGYDAGETKRVTGVISACSSSEYDPSLRTLWYPLIAWDIDRAACEHRLRIQGWPTVKSACYICPHMSATEWQALQLDRPDRFAIALEIERRARAAGHTGTASIFTKAKGTCLCLADGCPVPDTTQGHA